MTDWSEREQKPDTDIVIINYKKQKNPFVVYDDLSKIYGLLIQERCLADHAAAVFDEIEIKLNEDLSNYLFEQAFETVTFVGARYDEELVGIAIVQHSGADLNNPEEKELYNPKLDAYFNVTEVLEFAIAPYVKRPLAGLTKEPFEILTRSFRRKVAKKLVVEINSLYPEANVFTHFSDDYKLLLTDR